MIYELKHSNGAIITVGNSIEYIENGVIIDGRRYQGLKNVKLFENGIEISIEDKVKDKESDFNTWSERDKSLLKTLLKEINTIRTTIGLEPRTYNDVFTGIRNERG